MFHERILRLWGEGGKATGFATKWQALKSKKRKATRFITGFKVGELRLP